MTPVNVSNTAHYSSYTPKKAIDGNVNTRWLGDSSLPFPKNLVFDLGSRKCVDKIKIIVSTAISLPENLVVSVSEDNQNW
ncbi:MAG: discoidin domain-containing protein [Nanoarchaeota archaeon]|nr:discoidin domain-containing protein [Nanoarchaeota archaeon]